jgi:glycosyltransferase involved in cell wall biosynthesis
MGYESPELSVVIACSRPDTMSACLEGLKNQVGCKRFEVIVVGDIKCLEGLGEGLDIKLIACEEKHACVRRNIGIATSTGPLIAFLDDDTIPGERWVSTAVSQAGGIPKVLTGPEQPIVRGKVSELVFAVSQNRFAEGTRAHVCKVRKSVHWSDAPFCNFVIHRSVFDEVGMLATDIPWDMDDFEFCHRARSIVTFENVPELEIAHDRYPDSVKAFLAYKWRLRVRTGEKLISHPSLYGRIPSVLLCALLPWLLLSSFWIVQIPASEWGAALLLVYVAILTTQLGTAYRFAGMPNVIPYLAVIVALHVVTGLGVQVGLMRGVAVSKRPDNLETG